MRSPPPFFAAVVAATAADAQALPAAQQGPEAPQPQTAPLLTPELLNQMLAPIALYPDELLGEKSPDGRDLSARRGRGGALVSKSSQCLAQGRSAHRGAAAAKLGPEREVARARFPAYCRMMDAKLEWAERLGEAFLADPKAVMDAVQRLRQRARLRRQACFGPARNRANGAGEITIEAPTPEIIYAPVCDPSLIYGACGWESWPIVPLFSGLVVLDFRDHHIHIARDRFTLIDNNRPPIHGEEWRHDPSHRGNVPYRDPEVAARFSAAAPIGRSSAVSTSLRLARLRG